MTPSLQCRPVGLLSANAATSITSAWCPIPRTVLIRHRLRPRAGSFDALSGFECPGGPATPRSCRKLPGTCKILQWPADTMKELHTMQWDTPGSPWHARVPVSLSHPSGAGSAPVCPAGSTRACPARLPCKTPPSGSKFGGVANPERRVPESHFWLLPRLCEVPGPAPPPADLGEACRDDRRVHWAEEMSIKTGSLGQ